MIYSDVKKLLTFKYTGSKINQDSYLDFVFYASFKSLISYSFESISFFIVYE